MTFKWTLFTLYNYDFIMIVSVLWIFFSFTSHAYIERTRRRTRRLNVYVLSIKYVFVQRQVKLIFGNSKVFVKLLIRQSAVESRKIATRHTDSIITFSFIFHIRLKPMQSLHRVNPAKTSIPLKFTGPKTDETLSDTNQSNKCETG